MEPYFLSNKTLGDFGWLKLFAFLGKFGLGRLLLLVIFCLIKIEY
jgi:hypothetical protein